MPIANLLFTAIVQHRLICFSEIVSIAGSRLHFQLCHKSSYKSDIRYGPLLNVSVSKQLKNTHKQHIGIRQQDP